MTADKKDGQAAAKENQTKTDGRINQRVCSRLQEGKRTLRCEYVTHYDGNAVLWEDRLCFVDTANHLSQKTSIHTDVPATALLYDIVNAVYTKMYFLWKLWMCTVEQVVYVRQQTVQHTPVKLKTLIFNSKNLCECICWDWDGWHEAETDGTWSINAVSPESQQRH